MAQISLRIDEKTKREAEEIFCDLGLPMSTAITVFLKTVCREKRIPFELTVDPYFSESNMKYLKKYRKDIDEGRAHFAEHDLIEVDDQCQ